MKEKLYGERLYKTILYEQETTWGKNYIIK